MFRGREHARMPDPWANGMAARRNAIFVSWAEPAISFTKEISTIYEQPATGRAQLLPAWITKKRAHRKSDRNNPAI
jgi:hypothetical protein